MLHDLYEIMNDLFLGEEVMWLTSYFPMLFKKHMLTDPIVFKIIISQNQNN